MPELRQLSYQDEEALVQYLKEWYDNEEKIVPSNTDLAKYDSFKQMIDELNKEEADADWVPTTTLFYFKDDQIVGAVDIRHKLNKRLTNIGGHVGYGVRKSYRGQGIASTMLTEAMKILKTLGVETVLMTCNPKNYASQAVMKHCGGYEITPYTKKNGNLVSRFEIPNE
ncbi:GNAT family N-acetyltransferase [Staphylococcus petrasii]|uniref:GNAT family N-acetyltransferase n=1 Tax=Staphylococcus petrasii TaxID=1276936 RepID=UPI000CD1B442|nr:GNAT family N-acetyltransferase [Staphylococcus petrasii]PNZ83517.1 GNAT family N-acetyltransferase [Staphylococcus petrasii]TGA81998.1 GNAT family N-acetyltransferase [Staphylococcus petrasii]SUM60855.1 acetyltransferase family protein [Staphylococcus petrasii]